MQTPGGGRAQWRGVRASECVGAARPFDALTLRAATPMPPRAAAAAPGGARQATLAAFLSAPPAGGEPARAGAPRAGAQRTLDSLSKVPESANGVRGRMRPQRGRCRGRTPLPPSGLQVVRLKRGAPAADVAAAALPALADADADPAAALEHLRKLACVTVRRADLASTGVGAAVRRLKRCCHVDVAVSAHRLVEKWKAVVTREIQSGGGGGAAAG